MLDAATSKCGVMNFFSTSGLDARFQKGHVQHVIIVQHLPADAELLGHKPDRGDAAALAVAAVVHLLRRLVDMPAGNRLGAAETDNAAAALFFALS